MNVNNLDLPNSTLSCEFGDGKIESPRSKRVKRKLKNPQKLIGLQFLNFDTTFPSSRKQSLCYDGSMVSSSIE